MHQGHVQSTLLIPDRVTATVLLVNNENTYFIASTQSLRSNWLTINPSSLSLIQLVLDKHASSPRRGVVKQARHVCFLSSAHTSYIETLLTVEKTTRLMQDT